MRIVSILFTILVPALIITVIMTVYSYVIGMFSLTDHMLIIGQMIVNHFWLYATTFIMGMLIICATILKGDGYSTPDGKSWSII